MYTLQRVECLVCNVLQHSTALLQSSSRSSVCGPVEATFVGGSVLLIWVQHVLVVTCCALPASVTSDSSNNIAYIDC